jgi:hypothetical protein
MSEVQTQAPEAQAGQPPQGLDLTIQDLAALKSIVDVASQRGAFRPNEMVAVGTVYNKLNGFLEAVTAQSEAAKAAKEGA